VLYTGGAAAFVSAACWLFLDPDNAGKSDLPLNGTPEI
jgi:hypothetical protein